MLFSIVAMGNNEAYADEDEDEEESSRTDTTLEVKSASQNASKRMATSTILTSSSAFKTTKLTKKSKNNASTSKNLTSTKATGKNKKNSVNSTTTNSKSSKKCPIYCNYCFGNKWCLNTCKLLCERKQSLSENRKDSSPDKKVPKVKNNNEKTADEAEIAESV